MVTKMIPSDFDKQWRHLNAGYYLVTNLEGNTIWGKSHKTLGQKVRYLGRVARLLEPGTLWAWGRIREEAENRILSRVETIKGTKALPIYEDEE
jgi:hypothetical protein